MRITILLALLFLAEAQLPPEILVDRHMVRADRLAAEEDYAGALVVLDEIADLRREHALPVPPEFHFKYAQVAAAARLDTIAVERLTEYLLAAGPEGEFYTEALVLLDAAEERIRLADAERRRAEDVRRQAEERERENDALAQRQREAARVVFRDPLRSGGMGPEMVTVAAGQFEYRTYQDDDTDYTHPVRITTPFAIGKYEVTRGEFKRFVDRADYRTSARRDPEYGCNAPSTSRRERNSSLRWDRPGFRQTDRHPVTCVSIFDALAYARWLSEETGHRYFVPRAAEWQYAARAGGPAAVLYRPDWGSRAFDNDPTKCRRAHIPDCYPGRSRDGSTIEVGRLLPNGIGLHDMHGNAAELTVSCYHSPDPDYIGHLNPGGDDDYRLECEYVAAMGSSWYGNLVDFTSGYFSDRAVRVNKRRLRGRNRDRYERNSHTWVGFRVLRYPAVHEPGQ